MAPREPIPLTLPEGAPTAPDEVDDDDHLSPFTRGPEITEIH
jgi:hypothetical protein